MTSDIDRKVKLEKLFDNKKHVAPTVGEKKAVFTKRCGKNSSDGKIKNDTKK